MSPISFVSLRRNFPMRQSMKTPSSAAQVPLNIPISAFTAGSWCSPPAKERMADCVRTREMSAAARLMVLMAWSSGVRFFQLAIIPYKLTPISAKVKVAMARATYI